MADPALPLLPSPYPVDPRYAALNLAPAYQPPVQRAPIVAPTPQGFFTDVGHGFARGALVETPELVGKALQAVGANTTGAALQQAAEQRGKLAPYQVNPGGFGEAAANVVPALATAGLAFIPGVGEVAAPAAAAALYGGAQYTDTSQAIRKAGGSDTDAVLGGLGGAAVQGAGQALLGHVGGKFLTGAASFFAKPTAQGVLDSFAAPGLISTVAKNAVKAAAVQVPTQAAAAAAVTGIERAYGVTDEPTAWEAAKATVEPTLKMTALMTPFAAAGTLLTTKQRARVAETVQAPPDATQLSPAQVQDAQSTRTRAAMIVYREMKKVDPEGAARWFNEANAAINANAPVAMHSEWTFDNSQPQQEAPAPFSPLPTEPPITIHAPEHYQAQTIDIHEPEHYQAPTTQGYDVHELPGAPDEAPPSTAGYDVDYRDRQFLNDVPERPPGYEVSELPAPAAPRPDETINIHAPLQDEGSGGPKSGRGNQPTPDEVAARLQAAKAEPAPAQGTAAALGLLKPESPIVTADGGGFSINKQDRVQWLRQGLGSKTPSKLVSDLASLQPHELADALQQVWHDKGGEAASPQYVQRLETMYRQVTGKDIRDVATTQLGQRDAFSLDRPTAQTVERAQDMQADLARQPPAAALTSAEVRRTQNDLFTPTRTLRDIEDEDRRIIAGVDRIPGRGKYEALVHNAIQRRAIADAAKKAANGQSRQIADTQGAAENQGAEPRPAAGAANAEAPAGVEQVPQAARGAGAGAVAGAAAQEGRREVAPTDAQLLGAQDATRTGQRQGSSVEERENGNRSGSATEAGSGDRTVEGRQGNAQGQEQAQRQPVREGAAPDVKGAYAAKVEELRTARSGRSNLLAEINRNPKQQPSAEQFGRRQEIEQRIGQLAQERDQLRTLLDDEPKDTSPEPAAQDEHYQFAEKPLSPAQGFARGQNLLNLTSWLQAKVFTKSGEPWYRGIAAPASIDRMNNPSKAVREAAQRALDAMTPEQNAQYAKLAEMYRGAIELSRRMGETAQAAEARVHKALQEQIAAETRAQFLTDQANKLLAAGRITPERASELLRVAAAGREDALAKLDRMGRGIASFDDAKLGEHLQTRPSAVAAMERIAKTHANPLLRHVARVLADHLPSATVERIESPDFDGARYSPRTDTIEVGRGGMNAVTLLHETVHALAHRGIVDALANASRDPATLDAQQRRGVEALRTVRDVMEKFHAVADLSDPAQRLALDNEHEFVSEVLGNPTLQTLLGGRANLWQRVKDALGKFFGVQARSKTDFERVLEASPALFGSPLRSSDEVFRRSLLGDVMDDSPRGQLNRLFRAHEGLGGAGSKVADFFARKDLPARAKEEGYKWVTLNHLGQMMKLKFDRATREFTGTPAAAAVQDMRTSFRSWRDVISTKTSVSQWMNREGNSVAKRLASERSRNPKWFDRMTFMGTEATRLGFDPAAKSFAEAKQRNASLTEEQYNAPEARRLRGEYSALEAESARRRALDPKADTPVKLYHDVLDKHEADALRSYGMIARNAIAQFGMRDVHSQQWDALDIVKYRDLPTKEQSAKLRGALFGLHSDAVNLAKPIDDKARTGEKLTPEERSTSEFAQTIDDVWAKYQYHQSVPYMHLGRVGDYLLKFSVAGGDAEWDRVGALVGGDRTKGGLERAWGPMHGGNRDVYMRFEDESQFMKAQQLLKPLHDEGLFNDENGGSTWAAGKSADRFKGLDSASPRFVQLLKDTIERSSVYDAGTKEQLKRDITDAWISQLPETAPLKASLFRDGDVGYSKDFMNTFGNRLTMSKVGISNSYASPLLADTLRGLGTSLQTLERSPGAGKLAVDAASYINELKGRMSDLQTPVNSPVIDRMRALTASWRLAVSPAYMMMTMYQPWQVTLPYVGAKYGMAKAAGSMARNSALSFAILNQALKTGWGTEKGVDLFTKFSNLSDLDFQFGELKKGDGSPLLSGEQRDLLEHLRWSGLLNFGQTNQIARMDASEMGGIAKAARIASVFPHYAELSNRMTAMLTAHELALADAPKRGMNDAQAREFAKNFALQIVRDTDGDHSQANVARRLGRRGIFGAATPLAVGFQQYDIQMTELLARTAMTAWGGTSKAEKLEAGKALLGMGVMTSAMAGMLGLPFVGAATGIINGVQSLLQDDNTQPPDVQNSLRNAMDQVFGAKGGEIVSRGLPRLLDVDMSGRSGFQDIAPFSNFLADRRKIEDKLDGEAMEMMGPAVGALAGLWTGARAAYEGDYPKAINDALPAEVRNLGKAYRLARYGYETQGGNNQVPIPATDWNVFTQALGVQSGAKAEQSERAFNFNTNNQLLQHRQEVIRNEIYRAVDHGDYEKLGNLMQSMVDFTMQHPQYHSDVASGLRERAQARAVGAASGTGILTGPRMFPQLQNYSFGVDH